MFGCHHVNRQKFPVCLNYVCCALLMALTAGCGDNASNPAPADKIATESSDTGSAVFSIQWHTDAVDSDSTDALLMRKAIGDCQTAGVATITCEVYDESGNPIASGGPWPCDAGQGLMDRIPAGTNRSFTVLGWNSGATDIIYQGQTSGITITPGETEDVGTIDASPFVPVLSSPDNGQMVTANSFPLAWGGLANAHEYRIVVSEDSNFTTPFIDQKTSDTNFMPLDLSASTTYYWLVRAVDTHGNESAAPLARNFTTNATTNDIPTVTITAPSDESVFAVREATSFSCSANDTEDGELSGETLIWTSNIDGQIGIGDAFDSTLTEGNHTITLTAADSQGAIGQASIQVTADYTPPGVPQNVSGASASASQIDISWEASTDNIALAHYEIYRDDEPIATSTSESYSDTGLTQDTRYCYTIVAHDAAGHASAASAPERCVRTPVSRTWYRDNDGDNYGDPNSDPMESVSQPQGYVTDHTDCNDNAPSINPGASEACNGDDDDCDGDTDEGVENTYYRDADGDRFGDPDNSTQACTVPDGFVEDNSDCRDDLDSVNPDADETCNDIDDDCNGYTDDGVENIYYRDADGDRFGDPDNSTQACTVPDGFVEDNSDCRDDLGSVNPDASETCNDIDDDCNGYTDDGIGNTYYRDVDGDRFGDPDNSIQACTVPDGFVEDNSDCRDDLGSVNPDASETCNDIDDDCNGETDEGVGNTYYRDVDGDRYGDPDSPTQACTVPEGFADNNGDCRDDLADVNPGVSEVCYDDIDNNCNGITDEDCAIDVDIDNDFEYVDLGFPMELSTGQTAASDLQESPYEELREPDYSELYTSEFIETYYGYLTIGNSQDNRVSFVIVVIQGYMTPDRYELFIDSNNNEDLRDDGGPHTNQGTLRLSTLVSLSATVIDDSGNSITRPCQIWFFLTDASGVRFYNLCHYTGQLRIGGQTYNAIAFERSNHDGLYRESGLYIDLDGNNRLDEETEHFMDQAAITVNGQQYELLLNYP